MAIQVSSDPGKCPKNSSNIRLFVFLNYKKILMETLSWPPEAEGKEAQVRRAEAVQAWEDCKGPKWLWHGPFVFHLPRRFRFASVFLAVEKSNSPWIPSYKREADLAGVLGTVPFQQLQEMWTYPPGPSPFPSPHYHLPLERKWGWEVKCLFPSEILSSEKEKFYSCGRDRHICQFV